MTIAPELLRRIVEGALLAVGQPLSEDRLLSLIDEGERPEKAELRAVLEEIAESGNERGFELKQVASGWRFQVPEDLAPWINRLWEEKPQKYSRAILETLAIIAYRQPITRGDIEEIRGVAVSSHIVKTLSERGWIKVVGQRDVPGKPSLYATTREFLDYFNLRTLDDLPTLAEIRDIESLNRALDLGQEGENGAEAAKGEETDGAGEQPESTPDTSAAVEDGGSGEEEASAETASPTGETEAEPVEDAGIVEEIARAVAGEDDGERAEPEGEVSGGDAAPQAAEEEPEQEAGIPDEFAAETDGDAGPVSEEQPATDIEADAGREAVSDTAEAAAGQQSEEEPAGGLAAELPPSSLFASADSGEAGDEQDAREGAEDDSETRDTEQTENAPS